MIWEVNCPHFAGRRVVDLRRDVVREEEEDDDSEDEDDDDMPEVTAWIERGSPGWAKLLLSLGHDSPEDHAYWLNY